MKDNIVFRKPSNFSFFCVSVSFLTNIIDAPGGLILFDHSDSIGSGSIYSVAMERLIVT